MPWTWGAVTAQRLGAAPIKIINKGIFLSIDAVVGVGVEDAKARYLLLAETGV